MSSELQLVFPLKKKKKLKFKAIRYLTSSNEQILAAIKIQKTFRGYRGRLEFKFEKVRIKAATDIQRIARGMLVRLSDNFILTQVYLKLPPFWRQIVNSVPARPARQHVYQEDLKSLKEETKEMLSHILTDIFPNGVLPPKLPVIVPQPFDKQPYVSLIDGRRLPFYGECKTILSMDIENLSRSKKKNAKSRKEKERELSTRLEDRSQNNPIDEIRAPIHSFNIKFWPPTEPLELIDSSVLEHDPHLNGFEIGENKREYLICSYCHKRLEIIHCSTCRSGYCFFCAFQQHSRSASRNHSLSMIEPKIIPSSNSSTSSSLDSSVVSKSLIYHLDMAKQLTHDIRYLVKYLRSTAEVQRIQEEKRLRKEYEEMEEKKRLQFLKSQFEDKVKHDAVTKIASIFRAQKARSIVRQRILQVEMEAAANNHKNEKTLWTRVQRRFRQYSTRKWFASKGVKFNLNRKRKKKRIAGLTKVIHTADGRAVTVSELSSRISEEDLQFRVDYEAHNRRYVARQNHFHLLFSEFIDLSLLLDVNIQHWLEEDEKITITMKKKQELLLQQNQKHFEESQIIANQKSELSEKEYEILEKILKAWILKIRSTEEQLHTMKNMKWWISQHLRCVYRRKASLELRFQETFERLKWVSKESLCISQIEKHMKIRLDKFLSLPDTSVVTNWLKKFLEFAEIHQAKLDAFQQTILSEECNRLHRDSIVIHEFDSLITELIRGQQEDILLSSERISVEIIAMSAEPGTELAVQSNQQLIELQKKQKQLNHGVIDSIKVGLQLKMDSEDDKALLMFGFVNDKPDLPVQEMHQIQAILINKFRPSNHCELIEFLDVFLVQPFLSDEAVKDLRLEERISNNELELDRLNLKIKDLHSKIADSVESIKDREKKIQECKDEMLVYQDVIEGENEAERAERENIYDTLGSEIFKHENAIIITKQHMAKLAEEEPPINQEMGKIAEVIIKTQKRLQKRIDERKKLGELFFQVEKEINEKLSEKLPHEIEQLEGVIDQIKQDIMVCQLNLGPHYVSTLSPSKTTTKNTTTPTTTTTTSLSSSSSALKTSKNSTTLLKIENQQPSKTTTTTTTLKVKEKENEEEEEEELFDVFESHYLTYHEGCIAFPLDDLKALNICRYTSFFKLQECQHHMNPRLHGTGQDYIVMYINMQILIHESKLEYLLLKLENLKKEEKLMSSFPIQLPLLLEKVSKFHEMILNERRQKILQQELELRKKKIFEMRDYRLRQLKEEKEKAEIEAQKKEEERLANIKPKRRVLKEISDATKRNIRSVKDYIQKMQFSADQVMDEEEQRMAAALNKKAEGSKGGGATKPIGIRKLYLTKGSEEKEKFAFQQNFLLGKGLPSYKPLSVGLGMECQLWYQPIMDPRAFITDIILTHKEPTNPYHQSHLYPDRNLEKESYEKAEHPQVNLIIWYKRNVLRDRGLAELRVALNETDENRAVVDGFERVYEPPHPSTSEEQNQHKNKNKHEISHLSLVEFGLADVTLWWKKINKIIPSQSQNTNLLIDEIKKTRRMMKETPNEPFLQELLIKQTQQLDAAYRREESTQVTNPLSNAIDLLALTPSELESFMKIFEKIDIQKTSKISLDDIFSYFGEPATSYGKDIFIGMDALDNDKGIEFGDFLRTIATFCFYGKEEILRSLYLFADKDKVNVIKCDDFVALLNILHPFDKTRAKSALKLINISAGRDMPFEEFKDINDQFPAILHPAFRLQLTFRNKTMGEDWWVQKLFKYKQVREKMAKAGNFTDQLAELEMKRYEDDQQKDRRMKERSMKIQQAGGISKIILEARQLVDEYS